MQSNRGIGEKSCKQQLGSDFLERNLQRYSVDKKYTKNCFSIFF